MIKYIIETFTKHNIDCNQMSQLELQISRIKTIYKSNQSLIELSHIRKYKNRSRI